MKLYRESRNVTIMSRAVPLGTALEGCDWIGSLGSTVMYDALLYGKAVWQFYADHWPVLVDNWKTGLALRVSSEDHFRELVRNALTSGGTTLRAEAGLVPRVFVNHGRATQAVADVVASRLARRALSPQASAEFTHA